MAADANVNQMKHWKILTPLGIGTFVAALLVVAWQGKRFDETLQQLENISPSKVRGIRVTINEETRVFSSPEEIGNFLKVVTNLKIVRWGKTNDETSDIDFAIEPLNIRIDGHLRSGDPDHVYGLLGIQNGNTFVNYGTIRSKDLLTWTAQHIWLTSH